jgi:uncharacterized protein Yka (UPF0111/DUF47 family)
MSFSNYCNDLIATIKLTTVYNNLNALLISSKGLIIFVCWEVFIEITQLKLHVDEGRFLLMKNFKRVLVVGEENVFRELAEIIELCVQANEVMSRMLLKGYKAAALTESMQAMHSLEKRSEDVAFKVSEDITSGAVSPNVLDDLLESVQRADNILDLYYSLSRELGRMSKVDVVGSDLSYEAEWRPIFGMLVDIDGKAILKVKELLAASNLDSMVVIRQEIKALKEQGDDVKNGGFDKLYGSASKLSYVEFVYYSEVLHKLINILETCEALSDLVVSIVNSIMK